ncbi:MAG TPA: hypothetical protein VGV35_07950 [Bryobacteraceae bacterium]|nr:hypothetical protein [Bryobacteraceae bacterium]
MLRIGSMAAQKLLGILTAPEGVPRTVAELSAEANLTLPGVSKEQIVVQNVAPELAERATASKYPLLYVYCSKLSNQLREKFRTFSGEAQMVVEVRVSLDRLEEMESSLQAYIDAITQVVAASRGDWGDGVFYGGGYEVTFGAVKHGGRNFLQIAKVGFAVEISTD